MGSMGIDPLMEPVSSGQSENCGFSTVASFYNLGGCSLLTTHYECSLVKAPLAFSKYCPIINMMVFGKKHCVILFCYLSALCVCGVREHMV